MTPSDVKRDHVWANKHSDQTRKVSKFSSQSVQESMS